MKTMRMKTTLLAIMLLPVMLLAQSHSIDRIYERYAGADGFTSINISSEMFRLAATLGAASKEADMKEVVDIVAQLRGLKILVYDLKRESINVTELKQEVRRLTANRDFNELMSIHEKDSKVRFLTKNGSGNQITELVMVAESDKEIVLLSFVGLIDLAKLVKVAAVMDVPGKEAFEKLEF